MALPSSLTIMLSYSRVINISDGPTDGQPVHVPEPDDFEVVDNDGNIIEDASGIRGLLTYNGGTVCDDRFSYTEARLICQEMGYDRSSGWTSGSFYNDVQSSLNITLDNVDCSDGGSWSRCDYLTTHNCDHSEDVFLTCVTGETFQLGLYQTMKTISHAK